MGNLQCCRAPAINRALRRGTSKRASKLSCAPQIVPRPPSMARQAWRAMHVFSELQSLDGPDEALGAAASVHGHTGRQRTSRLSAERSALLALHATYDELPRG